MNIFRRKNNLENLIHIKNKINVYMIIENQSSNIWLLRYNWLLDAVINAIKEEKEKNKKFLIPEYKEIMTLNWLLNTYEKTNNQYIRKYLEILPGVQIENNKIIINDFKYVEKAVCFGALSGDVTDAIMQDNWILNEQGYEFKYKHNKDKIMMTYLNESIEIEAEEYKSIKNYIIEEKIKEKGCLKRVHELVSMIKI